MELEISDDETFGPSCRTQWSFSPLRQFRPSSHSRSTFSLRSVQPRESTFIEAESRWFSQNLQHQRLVLSDSSPVKTEVTEKTTQIPTTIRVFTVWSKKIPTVALLRLGPSNVFSDQPQFSLLSKLPGTTVSAESWPKTT